jgi:hypothetical protein
VIMLSGGKRPRDAVKTRIAAMPGGAIENVGELAPKIEAADETENLPKRSTLFPCAPSQLEF